MRTLIILISGIALFFSMVSLAKLFKPINTSFVFWCFIVVWFVVAAVNMWIGVSSAGYTFKDELPIFLVIFLIPVVIATFFRNKF